jgi:tRNA nucleotidyltransferase (CCA-adding enzyme)
MKQLFVFADQIEVKYGPLLVKRATNLDHSKINPKAIEACRILQEKGFQAYLVGGCVRDLLMGTTPKDWDIATNARPEQTKQVFPKTYDTGLQHGTITVSMGPTPADHFEVTTYRTEGDYSDGRRPDYVAFVDNIADDLSRRDLTINAIAYDPVNDQIVDPFGGLKDLNDKVIKAVGDPNERFSEDGLRTMRVARFAARLGFQVDPGTEQAISNNLDVLSKVSKERMRDELTKTLMTRSPSTGLNILLKTGALAVLGPAFSSSSMAQAFPAVDSSHGSMETKVAILLHSLQVPELEATLKDLKFSNLEIKKVLFLRLALQEYAKFHGDPTPLNARKFLAFIKNNGPEGFEISLAQFVDFAQSLHLPGLDKLQSLLTEKTISRKELAISGNDLMSQLNLQPGPKIKKLLDLLYSEVLTHPEVNEKSKLLELAKKFESVAKVSLRNTLIKAAAEDWWRLSDPEEKEFLEKEYDFGGGLKFKAKDIPEIASQVAVPAGPEAHHPEKNQLLHTNLVFEQAKKLSDDPMIWFAALMHDLGKSFTDPKIWPKQHGHEELGVPYVEHVSNLLGVTPEWKEFAKMVTENHLNCHRSESLSVKTLRRIFDWFNNDKEKFLAFITTCKADAQGRHGGYALKPYTQEEFMKRKWEEGLEPKKTPPSTLAISGEDLIREFGLKPGPELGNILKQIKELVAANPNMNERQSLLDFAKTLLIK